MINPDPGLQLAVRRQSPSLLLGIHSPSSVALEDAVAVEAPQAYVYFELLLCELLTLCFVYVPAPGSPCSSNNSNAVYACQLMISLGACR